MNTLEFKNMFKAANRTASNFDEFCDELELYLEIGKKSADADYSKMTDADFDRILEEVVSEMSAAQILAISAVNSILREELNNEVLTRWEGEQGIEWKPEYTNWKE